MTNRVHELELAQADIRSIVDWMRKRSPQGVHAWLDAYEEMIGGLARFAGHGFAPENKDVDFEVRQVFIGSGSAGPHECGHYEPRPST